MARRTSATTIGSSQRGFSKGGLAIYVFPLYKFNTLCSVQICKIAKPPLLNPLCELPIHARFSLALSLSRCVLYAFVSMSLISNLHPSLPCVAIPAATEEGSIERLCPLCLSLSIGVALSITLRHILIFFGMYGCMLY